MTCRVKEQKLKKKYVKDYVPTEKGDLQYCGKYYLSKITEAERKKSSLVQTIYGISCFALILISLCIPCKGNQTVYVVIPMELALICLWGYLSGSFALKDMKERMEQKDYDKAYQGPIQSLTVSIIFYVFSMGGQIIGILMNGSKKSSGDIYFAMILGFILVISCTMWNHQRKRMHYVTEEKNSK